MITRDFLIVASLVQSMAKIYELPLLTFVVTGNNATILSSKTLRNADIHTDKLCLYESKQLKSF